MRRFSAVLLLALAYASGAHAADSRIRTVNYNPQAVPTLYAYPGISSAIILGADEHIKYAVSGFGSGWKFEPRDNVERGSTITGEYQAGLHQGDERLFVLWNRIKTAKGVVVSLDSPGTDELGQSGISGYVDNHYFKRFGAAVLLSVFSTTQDIAKGAVQIAMQNRGRGINNTYSNTNINTGAPNGVVTSALNNSINIAPTLSKNQGDTIGIFVGRDLDFSTVYKMSSARWSIPR